LHYLRAYERDTTTTEEDRMTRTAEEQTRLDGALAMARRWASTPQEREWACAQARRWADDEAEAFRQLDARARRYYEQRAFQRGLVA
jgi:hypothetical protein